MKKLVLLLLVVIAIASLTVAGCRGQEAAPATPQQPAAPAQPQPAAPVATTAPQAPQQPATPLPAAPAPTAVAVTVAPVATPTAAPVARPAPTVVAGPKSGGAIRVTAQASIKSLDVGFAPAYVTYAVGNHIWETPFATDAQKEPQPQMVKEWKVTDNGKTWTFTLRDGLAFHDGTAVTTDDIIASFARWSAKGSSPGGQLVQQFMAADGLKKVDDRTFSVTFDEPYGGIVEAFAWPYKGLWVFPRKVAAIPHTQDAGQENIIGSGPYKLSKWEVGNRVTLERFAAYKPRSEPGSYLAGGKIAYLDQIVWLEIPDEETKIAGLKTGEWDVVDGAGLDWFKPLKEDPNISVATYPFHKSFVGFNPTESPTDKKLVRQAIIAALDVEALMSALGPKETWFLCPAVYYCNTPLQTDAGKEFYNQRNVERAKQLLKDAGYSGEPIKIMNPTDYATITPLGPVIKAQLEAAGMKVEMPAMDWATLISKIYSPGWNIFTSWSTHNAFGNPVMDLNATEGGTGYGGKPFTVEGMVQARLQYALAQDPQEKLKHVETIQRLYYDEIPRYYLGQWSSIYPHRKYVKNLSVPAYPLYINVWIEK